jgi:hypothetical protein
MQLVEGGEDRIGGVDGPEADGDRAGLDAGDVEQVRDQGGEVVQAVARQTEQFRAIVLSELGAHTRQPCDGGRRGGQRAPDVVGDGGQQRGADLVRRLQRPDLAGLRLEVAMVEDRAQLGGDDAQQTLVGGVEVPADHRQIGPLADGDRRAGTQGPGISVPAEDGGAARGSSARSAQAHGLDSEGLAGRRQDRAEGVVGAQDGVSQADEDLRLGRRPSGLASPPRRPVDDQADEDRDEHVEHEDDQVAGRGHGDRAIRGDEEEVEGETGGERREEGGPQAADEGDDDHDELERQRAHGQRVRVDGGARDPRHGGDQDERQEEPERAASRGQGAARGGKARPGGAFGARDDVDVDRAGGADDLGADPRPAEDLAEPCPPARPEDELRGVVGSGEAEERLGHGLPDELVIGAPELLDEFALAGERSRDGRAQAVLGRHVHGQEVAPARPRRDPRATPGQRLPPGVPGEGDDDAFARLPKGLDVVGAAVVAQSPLDVIGQPEQGELPHRRQVAEPEVVRQGRVDPLRGADLALSQPRAQGLGREVHELDLVRAAQDLVGHRLALGDAGDLLDDVVQRLDVLDVDRRDDAEPALQEVLDVLPSFLMARARGVRVGELVDEDEVGRGGQDRVRVHLPQLDAPVGDAPPRRHREPVGQGRGLRPSVGLHDADEDAAAGVRQPVPLLKHGVGLAGPGRGPEKHMKPSSRHGCQCGRASRARQIGPSISSSPVPAGGRRTRGPAPAIRQCCAPRRRREGILTESIRGSGGASRGPHTVAGRSSDRRRVHAGRRARQTSGRRAHLH